MTRHHLTPPKPLRGFTLIELLVTVSLMAVLMMVAVPSFQSFQRSSELSGATIPSSPCLVWPAARP